MESIKGLPGATLDALMRDWTIWVAILSITLAFMVYMYLFPTAMDFFTGTQQKQASPGKNTAHQ
jgi:hypothetical protein